MKLYEIDEAILGCIDTETGEVIDPERLTALQMERTEKIEGVALWIKDIKAEIEAEKKDLIENCANAVKPSSTMGPLLEFMYTKEKWETAQVIYGMQMSVFREELTFKISNIQLHKYIPQNMEKLLEKLASFLEYTYQEYFLYSLQQEDNLLAAYTQISQYLYNLVDEIIVIRNDALMEMELFLKAVQASKSVTELSALLEQKEQETNAA